MFTFKPHICNLNPSILCLVLFFQRLWFPFQGSAQKSAEIYVKNAVNSFSQPFVKIINLSDDSQSISGINGLYRASPGNTLSFEHFMYKPKTYIVNDLDTVQMVFLEPLNLETLTFPGILLEE